MFYNVGFKASLFIEIVLKYLFFVVFFLLSLLNTMSWICTQCHKQNELRSAPLKIVLWGGEFQWEPNLGHLLQDFARLFVRPMKSIYSFLPHQIKFVKASVPFLDVRRKHLRVCCLFKEVGRWWKIVVMFLWTLAPLLNLNIIGLNSLFKYNIRTVIFFLLAPLNIFNPLRIHLINSWH